MEGHIAHVQEVVCEVFLDHIALIAAADHKLFDSMGAKDLEDVPEDRLAADFHHGLGLEVGFFADAGAKATSKDYSFHGLMVFSERVQEVIGSRCRGSSWAESLPASSSQYPSRQRTAKSHNSLK